MKRKGPFLTALLIACLGLFAGGCQQWAFSVDKEQMKFVPGEPVKIVVNAEMEYTISGFHGITARPFAVPDPIFLTFTTTGKEWAPSKVERQQDANHYAYIFTGILNEAIDHEYMLNPKTTIVNSKGAGKGPYRMTVDPVFIEGREAGRMHVDGHLRTYRLVVDLRAKQQKELWSSSEVDAFLAGFTAAYKDRDMGPRGEKYAEVVRASLADRAYEQGFQEGRRHVDNQVSDAYIQGLIGRNISLGSTALAWKAGYIEGFAEQIQQKNQGRSPDSSLQLGETVYDSLKHGIGF